MMRFLAFFVVTFACARSVDPLQSFLSVVNNANFKEENLI